LRQRQGGVQLEDIEERRAQFVQAVQSVQAG
jgi:hypothetical protein